MHKYNFGQVPGVHLLSRIPTNFYLHFLNFLQIYINFGSFDEFLGIFKTLRNSKNIFKMKSHGWAESDPRPQCSWAGSPLSLLGRNDRGGR
jgi:hypothetical protein